MKVVVGRYSIDEAIKNRAKLISEITGSVTNLGDDIVKIDSLQVEDIVFSKVVLDAAEKRTVAEMLVNTKEQQRLVAEKEASIQVIQAQAQADSNLKIATAQADAVKLQGEAEAAALRAKNDAIKESPNLVELTKAQKWDGKLPTSFIPGSATPFLNIK
jgi:regulator of protease activity HflC (stomatin/prohibitin superfamily)